MTKSKLNLPRVPIPPPTKVVPDKTKVNDRGSVKAKLRRTKGEE